MLNVFSLANGRLFQEEIESVDALKQVRPVWVDLESPSPEEKGWIAAHFGLHLPADIVDDDLEESARFYEEDNGELHIRSDFLIEGDDDAEEGKGDRNVRARALVTAAGGFEANIEWLKEYWGEAADNFLIRGTPYNRGSILKMLLAKGVQEIGDLLVKLSGAEGKKVLHARSKKGAVTGDDLRHWALLAQPSMMLLDEPTASMDAQTEVRVMTHLFQEVKPDSTLVIVTHKPSLLPLVQRLIVMAGNSIVLDGPKENVLHELQQRHAKVMAQLAAQSETVASA